MAPREKAIFLAALDLSSGDRASFVERECAGDRELAARVTALIGAHDEADERLAEPTEFMLDRRRQRAFEELAGELRRMRDTSS